MYPKLVKEIRSKTGELHFKRWQLLAGKTWALYLHYIAKSDEDKDPHNHPWILRSIILCGGYISDNVRFIPRSAYFEEFRIKSKTVCKIGTRQLITKFDFHKITLLKPTWSLALVTDKCEDWGYLTKDGYIDHIEYRKLKHELQNQKN